MNLPPSVDYYTMYDYCVIIRDYVIAFENGNSTQYDLKPREDILKAVQDDSPDPAKFPVVLMDTVGSMARILYGFGNNPIHHPNWIGGGKETLSKETFINTMRVVWPELGV